MEEEQNKLATDDFYLPIGILKLKTICDDTKIIIAQIITRCISSEAKCEMGIKEAARLMSKITVKDISSYYGVKNVKRKRAERIRRELNEIAPNLESIIYTDSE